MNTSNSIISIDDLSYSYTKKQRVLTGVNLSVPTNSIYGFLGENGAGKSTTIRSMVGLLKPQRGTVKLFGEELAGNRITLLQRIGTLIEAPSLYQHLSGYDNLNIACKYLNLPKTRIIKVLEIVGLTANAHKISKQYSTGMKQRLGIAFALLSDPELLILDEPTNGLDPNGIIEIRTIIKRLYQDGKTIFLSSHMLSEIEKLATQVGIIKNGQMIFQGTIEALDQARTRKLQAKLTTHDSQQVETILQSSYPTHLIDQANILIDLKNRESLPLIIEQLVANGVKVYEVTVQKNSLENLFVDLTTQ